MITFFDHPHVGTMTDVAACVGGKGASLWAMTHRLGLPVPPGFTIGTDHAATGMTEPLFADVLAALDRIGTQLGRYFGDPTNPLLVSVRSGAPVSMPGMMDTVLNVGMTEVCGAAFGSAAFASATRAALHDQFARLLPDCDPSALRDPKATLRKAIDAVYASWHSPRARSYRAREGISDRLGTAVTIQAMVFGHRDARSGTGVVFSRNPSTGAPGATGDWLPQAQGEAVVSGTHPTLPLAALADHDPESHGALLAALDRLELHYRDMVDVEFTIESGQLWILQARAGKRTSTAAARIACDLMDHAGIRLSQPEALARVPASMFDNEICTQSGMNTPVARGLGVSPGLVSGRVAVDCDQAIALAEEGNNVILVRAATSPEDVHGMGVAVGILTATGGMMSHAALVAREWGIAAVCGAPIVIDDRGFEIGTTRITVGETISIDGATGDIFLSAVAGTAISDPHVERLRQWASKMSMREKVDG